MSEHTPKSTTVLVLPDRAKVESAVSYLRELRESLTHLQLTTKRIQTELNTHSKRVNNLLSVLEAK